MNYETFTITDWRTEQELTYVTIYLDENNAKTFPADESNPDYVAFIEDNPDAIIPA